MKKVTTWVLVADSSHARVFENTGPGTGLAPVPEGSMERQSRPDREIASDRPGRSFDSHGQGRHAMAYGTDPAEHEKREFARVVAVWIDDAAQSGKFDRLVVVAAPKTLGDLRSMLSPAAQKRLACDLDKDLTASDASEIIDALSNKIVL